LPCRFSVSLVVVLRSETTQLTCLITLAFSSCTAFPAHTTSGYLQSRLVLFFFTTAPCFADFKRLCLVWRTFGNPSSRGIGTLDPLSSTSTPLTLLGREELGCAPEPGLKAKNELVSSLPRLGVDERPAGGLTSLDTASRSTPG
jgi:hypothetical protein